VRRIAFGTALLLLAGCTAPSARSDPSLPDPPPACDLLSTVEVAAATGLADPRATPELHLPATTRACGYLAANGSARFFIEVENGTGTADEVARREIGFQPGTPVPVPGLWDAAYATPSAVVATHLEGSPVTVVRLVCVLPGPAELDRLAGLVRTLIERA
jgi:hypothetical protein